MKWKKVISILLAAVLCMSFLMGCGSEGGTKGNKLIRSQSDSAIDEINSSLNHSFKTTEYDYQFSEEFDTTDLHYIVYKATDSSAKADVKLSFIFKKGKTEFVAVKIECNNYLSQVYSFSKICAGHIDLFGFTPADNYSELYDNAKPEIGDFKILYKVNPNSQMIIYQKDYESPNLL